MGIVCRVGIDNIEKGKVEKIGRREWEKGMKEKIEHNKSERVFILTHVKRKGGEIGGTKTYQ
jgi:hypothetical protein